MDWDDIFSGIFDFLLGCAFGLVLVGFVLWGLL